MENKRSLENYHVVYERALGSVFYCGMNILKVMDIDALSGRCQSCFFFSPEKGKCDISESAREYVGRCEFALRTDRLNVYFKKVGEQKYDEV